MGLEYIWDLCLTFLRIKFRFPQCRNLCGHEDNDVISNIQTLKTSPSSMLITTLHFRHFCIFVMKQEEMVFFFFLYNSILCLQKEKTLHRERPHVWGTYLSTFRNLPIQTVRPSCSAIKSNFNHNQNFKVIAKHHSFSHNILELTTFLWQQWVECWSSLHLYVNEKISHISLM